MDEPVAWMYKKKDGTQVITDDPDYKDGSWIPLYTDPPQRECCCGDSSELGVVHRADAPCFHYEQREWQGLTDEEINALHYELKCAAMGATSTLGMYRILEKALKEKNHAKHR